MTVPHLVKRFFGSLKPKEPAVDEVNWVHSQLLPTEFDLWKQMSLPDRRHSYDVARRTEQLLGDKATRPVLAAALLHDVGKVRVKLGTFMRVFATLAGSTATTQQKESWAEEDGWLGQAGRYLQHNETGAEMLAEAGSDALTIAWAREHELLHTEWTLPEDISTALWKADNA